MTSLKQKISAIMVLSLFLLSVLPMGLADLVELVAGIEVNADTDSNEGSNVEVEAEAEAEVDNSDSGKGSRKDLVKREVNLLKREVTNSKEILEKARVKLEVAKERYQEAKEEQREHREKVLELHKLVRNCDSEKRNCTALKLDLRLGVKNHLLKSVQVVERSLEKLSNTVEKMEDLSEEEKESALDLVADLEAELDTHKVKIEGFTNETTQEEIRATIKDLKELNQKVHKLQRRVVGLLVNAKLHILVEKQAELRAGMETRIDTAAEAGADVSGLQEILAEFDDKVDELEQDYEAAKQKWTEAKDSEDFDQFNRELRAAQHEVREDLVEIKKILRKFMAEYKEVTEDSDEDEAVNETEDSEEDSEDDESEENETDDVETNTTLENNSSVNATA